MAIGRRHILLRREGIELTTRNGYGLSEERLTVKKRGGRKRAGHAGTLLRVGRTVALGHKGLRARAAAEEGRKGRHVPHQEDRRLSVAVAA